MNYIQTGEIVSVHGIKGEVKVYPWADYPEFLEEFDRFYIQKNKMHFQAMNAEQVRCHKNMVIIKKIYVANSHRTTTIRIEERMREQTL